MVDARRPASEADALPAPPIDKVGEDVAMARIQGALFGESTPPTLERYALLEKLGEGSYGAVYSAWDPRLDRKVAIKVLHGGATEELEREARALAKLAHPNVVTVHDVGEAEQELFLAMEFVDGTPLSAMDTKALGWRGVITTYRQAAAGLAAAHEAGIVHRDFKPDNALLGTDGRVRVLDFGLARAGLSSPDGHGGAVATRSAGTPRYMAPEQHRGDAVDARTDQYCFCVALWEAVYAEPAFPQESLDGLRKAKGTPPEPPTSTAVPARVARALQRGLSPKPADRFPSMGALDAALGRTLAGHARTIGGIAIVGVALTAGVAFGQSEPACQGSDTLPERWTDATRSALSGAFASTGVPYAESSGRTADAALDRWAKQWAAAREDACLDHERGVQSAQGLDLRTQCLDAQRHRFDAQLDVFLEADGSVVDNAVAAAAALPSPETCSDVEALRTAHPVPAEAGEAVASAQQAIARGQAEVEARRTDLAAEVVAPVLEACQSGQLAHPPTCVEAGLVAANAASFAGKHKQALEGLRAAAIDAQRAQLPESFARAAAGLTWELGEIDFAFDSALTWAAMGHASIEGRAAPALRSTLLNCEGSVLSTAGRWDEAAAVHQKRLEELEADSPLRMQTLTNIANIDNQRGHIEAAERAYAEALEIGLSSYGATHPRVLLLRSNRGGLRAKHGRAADALPDLIEALEGQRAVLGPEHPNVVATLTNLAIAQLSVGETEAALRNAREAKRIVRTQYGKNSGREIECLLIESDALLTMHRTDEAVRASERATTLARSTYGEEHLETAYAIRSWGAALREHGETDLGTKKLRVAKALFNKLGVTLEADNTEVE